jgi:hypothetical protein
VTVSGIAAVSVISGQDMAERQDSSYPKSARSAQTQPLADHETAGVPQDTVTFSGGGRSQIADVAVYSRYLQQNNLVAIAAYQAIQPTIRRPARPAVSTGGGKQAAPEVSAEFLAQEEMNVMA